MHEAIITEELFEKVQKKRDINKTIKEKETYMELNGLIKCKRMWSKMTLKVEYKRTKQKRIKI